MPMRIKSSVVLHALAIGCLLAGTATLGQFETPPQPTAGRNQPPRQNQPDNTLPPFFQNNRQKWNEDRQKRLVSDTQRLVRLASELKAEVASSGAESLTPEMQKKMDEIEKLAKSVKDKMRD
jgi:hypothetical protein